MAAGQPVEIRSAAAEYQHADHDEKRLMMRELYNSSA